jgi:hypothetical protein
MIDHRSADAATPRCLSSVHGLQLCVARIKLLQRSDSEQFTVEATAEERECRIEEAVAVKRVDVLGRAVRIGEREMLLE